MHSDSLCLSPMLSRSMRMLYWVDSQLEQVGHIDFQGNDKQIFTSIGEITQPFSLTVYKGGLCQFLYFFYKTLTLS